MTSRSLSIENQSWPLENEFRISRGAKTEANVILLSITENDYVATAEAVPYLRYGETIDSVKQQIQSVQSHIENGATKEIINLLLPPGAARNLIDCALWDLEAKRQNTSVTELAMTKTFKGCICAQTISLGSIGQMAQAAGKLSGFPLIKVKLDQHNVIERMKAIHQQAPGSDFIIDANEAWRISLLNSVVAELEKLNVVLIEQPLPSSEDQALTAYVGNVAICADESIHTSKDLDRVASLYQCINIKLDKTGGLSEALKLLRKAQARQLKIMVGCMVGTSLAMAPASIVATYADFVDLDGPALLANDRDLGFIYKNGKMSPLNPRLWGSAHSIKLSPK